MQRIPSKHQNQQGFTLIELLTVMAIIAVLVGLLFPVASAVTNSAKKTQAGVDIKSIATSVSSYQADYGKLPLTVDQLKDAASGLDVVYGGSDANATSKGYQLYDILSAREDQVNGFNTDDAYNPKKVVYFEANNVKNPKAPRNGILTEKFDNGTGTIQPGSLVDSWGDEYAVFLDANSDGDLAQAVTLVYSGYTKKFGPRGSVCAASMGPDKKWGSTGSISPENSDDVYSWK